MATSTNRRGFLNKTLLGTASAGALLGQHEMLVAADDAPPKPADAPASASDAAFPQGQVGKVKMSRMLLGGNLMGGWAHSRDLNYVTNLFKAYNTEAKVFETMALAEKAGINTVQIDPACLDVYCKYLQRGGKMQSVICMPVSDNYQAVADTAKRLVDSGATMIYVHGGVAESIIMSGGVKIVAKSLEIMRKQGTPVGIGSHSLEVPMISEKEGLPVDFYLKTLHIDRYWSATPKEYRQEWCWHKPMSEDYRGFHDNMWCLDADKTVEFMATVKKPWIAFKVLAAGAIHPSIGFSHAFRSGADFICVGMFDFQIEQDAAMVKDVVQKSKHRKRPWCA
jgi:hypothetical protein